MDYYFYLSNLYVQVKLDNVITLSISLFKIDNKGLLTIYIFEVIVNALSKM